MQNIHARDISVDEDCGDGAVRSSALPDDPTLEAEMAAAFGWDDQPTPEEMDALHAIETAPAPEPEVVGLPGSRDVFAVLVNGHMIGAVTWCIREGGFYAINSAGKRIGDVFDAEGDAAAAVLAAAS
jgi:hypothetical protein